MNPTITEYSPREKAVYYTLMAETKNRVIELLRKSERILKTDMVYLAKGSFWNFLGQGTYAVMSFILALAFARLVSPESYGTYKFIIAMFGVLSITNASGINTALVQAVARGFEGSIKQGLSLRLRLGLLGTLGALLLSLYYYVNENFLLSLSFLLLSPLVPLVDGFTTYTSIWAGKKRFDILTTYASITHILSCVSLIVTLFLTDNILIFLLSYFVPLFLLRVFFHKRTFLLSPPNEEKDPGTISAGLHFTFMSVFPLIAQQLDKILLFHYLGAAQTAVYAFATAIPDQVKSSMKGVQGLIIPKFAEKDTSDIGKSIRQKLLPTIFILSVVALLYALCAPFIYSLLFPAYASSIPYSQIYSISIIALAFILPHSMLQAKLATKELYQFNITRSITQIALLFIGVYYAGVWGVILARVLSEFLSFFILLFLSSGYEKRSSLS